MDDSLLVVDESVVGSAVGHLTLQVPGEKAFIDTYVSVRNEEEVVQGSLNSTLRWSTSSSWQNNGDIYFFGDLTVLELPTQTYESWRVRETLTYGDKQYRASTYLFQEYTETLSAYGEGQYLIENGYKW
jgi:hypothetical protein